jgi:hypothetical protein
LNLAGRECDGGHCRRGGRAVRRGWGKNYSNVPSRHVLVCCKVSTYYGVCRVDQRLKMDI